MIGSKLTKDNGLSQAAERWTAWCLHMSAQYRVHRAVMYIVSLIHLTSSSEPQIYRCSAILLKLLCRVLTVICRDHILRPRLNSLCTMYIPVYYRLCSMDGQQSWYAANCCTGACGGSELCTESTSAVLSDKLFEVLTTQAVNAVFGYRNENFCWVICT